MEWFFLEIKVKYKLSVYDTIVLVLVIITVTRRTQRSLIQAITSKYGKTLAFNSKLTLLKKLPEEINDSRNRENTASKELSVYIYDNLTLFKTKFIYSFYLRGGTDSNVRIML